MSFSYTHVVIFGSTGMLGTYVTKYFRQRGVSVIPLTRKDYDLSETDPKTLETLLLTQVDMKYRINQYYSYSGDSTTIAVINCAGVIPHRGTSPTSMWMVNTIFPLVLANLCEKHDFKLLHISTDCVYHGNSWTPDINTRFSERSLHDELGIYGKSKSIGEPVNTQIIRTSIIGEENNNKLSLLEWLRSQQGDTVSGFLDYYWNGVTCLQLAKILYHILETRTFWIGVRHIFSECISKHDLLVLIKNIYQLNVDIKPVKVPIMNKTLTSIYPYELPNCIIPSLSDQITEMANFLITENVNNRT